MFREANCSGVRILAVIRALTGSLLLSEMFVVRQMQRFGRQFESDMMSTMIARWKRFIADACDLMFCGVIRIVNNIVNAGFRHFLAGFEGIASFSHVSRSVCLKFWPGDVCRGLYRESGGIPCDAGLRSATQPQPKALSRE